MAEQCCAILPDGSRCEKDAVFEGRYDCCEECMAKWKSKGSLKFYMKPEVRERTGYPYERLVCLYVLPEEEKETPKPVKEEKLVETPKPVVEEAPKPKPVEEEKPKSVEEGFKPTKDLCVTILAESVDGVKEKCKEFQSILQDQLGAYVTLLRALYKAEGKEGRKSLRTWLKEEGVKIEKVQKAAVKAVEEKEKEKEKKEE